MCAGARWRRQHCHNLSGTTIIIGIIYWMFTSYYGVWVPLILLGMIIASSRKIIIMLHFVSPTNLKSYLKNIKRRIKYRHLIQEHYLTDHHNFKQQVMMIFHILLLHLSPPLIFPTPPLKYFYHCSSWHVTPCHCHHRRHQQERSGASHFHQMTSTV